MGFRFHPNILIVTEGYTEKRYFEHLKQRNAGYTIHVEKSPQEKAVKAMRSCINIFRERFSRRDGDVAYCVIDVDNNPEKDIINVIELAKRNNVRLILSKPCFEIYYLMHFTDKVQMRVTSKEMKEELRKYIPDYCETKDCWDILLPNQRVAIERSRAFVLPEGDFSLGILANGTNIHVLFDEIREFKKEWGFVI